MSISEHKIFFLLPLPFQVWFLEKNTMTGIAGANVTNILRALSIFTMPCCFRQHASSKNKQRKVEIIIPSPPLKTKFLSLFESGIRTTEFNIYSNLRFFFKKKNHLSSL